jgi:hypothetical protein
VIACRFASFDTVQKFSPRTPHPFFADGFGVGTQGARHITTQEFGGWREAKGRSGFFKKDFHARKRAQQAIERILVTSGCGCEFGPGFWASDKEIRDSKLGRYGDHLGDPKSTDHGQQIRTRGELNGGIHFFWLHHE